MPFITDEQARGMTEQMRQRALVDPAFAEDFESLWESMPFFVECAEASRPIRCECCGTWVTLVPESRAADMRSWEPAVWEAETWRKHTLRRCNWKREQATS